jgi:hypothetical protein
VGLWRNIDAQTEHGSRRTLMRHEDALVALLAEARVTNQHLAALNQGLAFQNATLVDALNRQAWAQAPRR